MPDGCVDLLWDGRRLSGAGPDNAARWPRSAEGTAFVALRFSGGVAPALLGVPADELRDRAPDLEELWPTRRVRVLTERVERDPSAVLEAWVVERAARRDLDPFALRVWSMAMAGTSVAAMSARLGISSRQLHRRCLPAFGYGPIHLARVLGFGQAPCLDSQSACETPCALAKGNEASQQASIPELCAAGQDPLCPWGQLRENWANQGHVRAALSRHQSPGTQNQGCRAQGGPRQGSQAAPSDS